MRNNEAKLILIGNYANDGQESMQRFATMLLDGFSDIGFKVVVLRPTLCFGAIFRTTTNGFGKWLGYVDKWLLFPIILKLRILAAIDGHSVHYHICDHSNAPYLSVLPGNRTVITCHDVLAIRGGLGYPDSYCEASSTGVILQKWILKHLSRAKQLAAVSQLTLDQLKELTPFNTINPNWKVIYNSFNALFYKMDPQKAWDLLGESTLNQSLPFILHVGSGLPRKNRAMLIKMAAALALNWDGQICFAGEPLNDEDLDLAISLGVKNHIVSIVKPDHETLVALYSTCSAFIFPSFSEGFGWPLIEAQACGAAVISSHIQPMPEVGGTGALYADPNKPEEFASRFLSLKNLSTREGLISNGYDNIKRFNKDSMIEQYLRLHQNNACVTEDI